MIVIYIDFIPWTTGVANNVVVNIKFTAVMCRQKMTLTTMYHFVVVTEITQTFHYLQPQMQPVVSKVN